MSLPQVHVLHGVKLPGGTFFSQVQDTSPKNNHDVLMGYAAGHPQPLFMGLRSQKPEVTFTTTQCATALGALGLFGASQSAGPVKLFYKEVADLGSRVSSSSTVHKVINFNNAFAYIQRVASQQGQEGTVNIRIVPTWDGTNAPITAAGSQALSDAPASGEFFTLGPLEINGTTVGGLQSFSLDFNPEMYELASDGEAWLTWCAVKQIQPQLTAELISFQPWLDYGLPGVVISSFAQYMRKRSAAGGVNVADATASHIKFTSANGLVVVDGEAAGDNDEARCTLVANLAAVDSTVNTMTINTASAVT